MTARRYLIELASRGRYHFTSDEALAALGGTAIAVRASLRRLKEKGDLATPVRGFHLILPPEYRALGCLPPEQFIPQLMTFLRAPYYVGLLSAAEFLGAAHQRPQQFQVVTARNRLPISCGRVGVVFVARQGVAHVPTVSFNTPRGDVKVSTAEATALDLVTYADHAGGFDHVATVLAELAERLDGKRLLTVAKRTAEMPTIQRLGYLLDLVGQDALAAPLAEHVAKNATHAMPLLPSTSMRGAERHPRWKLAINTTIEVES